MAVTRNDQSRPTANHNYPSLARTAIPAAHRSSSVPSMDDKQLRRAIETTLSLSAHASQQPVTLRSNRRPMTWPEATLHSRHHLNLPPPDDLWDLVLVIVTIALHEIITTMGRETGVGFLPLEFIRRAQLISQERIRSQDQSRVSLRYEGYIFAAFLSIARASQGTIERQRVRRQAVLILYRRKDTRGISRQYQFDYYNTTNDTEPGRVYYSVGRAQFDCLISQLPCISLNTKRDDSSRE